MIIGEEFEEKRKAFENKYLPNKIILGGTKGTLPLLQDKIGSKNSIFVCKDKTCQLPVNEVSEAFKQIVE